ncbi:MAG: acyltransferase [Burkholderiaceae bacterium]|nr:acyltransferase [Burkholderiaceae bacterium]
MKSNNITYLPGVDHLRAFAAVWILAYHAFHLVGYALRFHQPFTFENYLHSDNPLIALVLEGHTAVALFMTLSGFIFAYGAYGAHVRFVPFMANRLLRIYPVYLFLLWIAVSVAPASVTLPAMAETLLPLANLPSAFHVEPYTDMFWAVAVEFQFYLLFPMLAAVTERRGVRVLIGVIVLALAVRVLIVAFGGNAREVSYWTFFGRVDQFLLGMIAARVYVRLMPSARQALLIGAPALLIACGGLVGFHHLGGWVNVAWWRILWTTGEGIVWAVCIVCYLPLAARLPGVIDTALQWVGTRSFSIYMLHMIVIHAVIQQGWLISGTGLFKLLAANFLFIILPLTVAIAALSFVVLERPFLDLRRKYLVPNDAMPA